MNESFPQQNIKLKLKIVEQGVLFLFHRSSGGSADLVQVPQTWLSIHSLLSRLRMSRTYCAKEVPLLIWKEGEELHIKFHAPKDQMVEECLFSSEETIGILTMLERLPSLN